MFAEAEKVTNEFGWGNVVNCRFVELDTKERSTLFESEEFENWGHFSKTIFENSFHKLLPPAGYKVSSESDCRMLTSFS